MFEEPFREGEEQPTISEEINGVIAPQSFKMLVCLDRVVFRECAPDVAITTTIELLDCPRSSFLSPSPRQSSMWLIKSPRAAVFQTKQSSHMLGLQTRRRYSI
jgi:hypothetical protein